MVFLSNLGQMAVESLRLHTLMVSKMVLSSVGLRTVGFGSKKIILQENLMGLVKFFIQMVGFKFSLYINLAKKTVWRTLGTIMAN